MKHIKILIALCSLAIALIFGCNYDSSRPTKLQSTSKNSLLTESGQTFETAEGTVVINSYVKDSSIRTILFDVTLQSSENGAALGDYQLLLSDDGGIANMKAGTYSLRDANQQLLFELEFAWDTLTFNSIRITERTTADELQIDITELNGNFREKYRFANGDSCSFDFPIAWREREFGGLGYSKNSPDSEPQLKERAMEFFTRHQNSDLTGNSNGNLLVGLVKNSNFQSWLDQEFPVNSRTTDDGQKKLVCRLAELCAAIKCIFGGALVNPLCGGCAGTLIGCLFDKLITGFDW